MTEQLPQPGRTENGTASVWLSVMKQEELEKAGKALAIFAIGILGFACQCKLFADIFKKPA